MDCKHEKIIALWEEDGDITFMCGCDDLSCFIKYQADEVVILTKAQHQLMQDVIEAGEGVIRNSKAFDDGGYTCYVVEQVPLKKLQKALDERKE